MPAHSDTSHPGRPRSPAAPLTGDAEILALYGSFCLFLSTIEFLIPKPLPFFRLGLANLPILLALRTNKAGEDSAGKSSLRFILALVGLKILGQALVNGTLFSYIFVFSTAGSLASGITMSILSLVPARYLSLVGISVMGALASNLVQILLARYFLLGEGAWLIGPPFLAIGTVTGILLGAIAHSLSGTPLLSPFPRKPPSKSPEPDSDGSLPNVLPSFLIRNLSPGTLFLAGVTSLPPFLFSESLPTKGALVLFYFLCAGWSGKRIRILPNLLAFLGIVAAHLVTPIGQVLFYLGRFPVTLGALRTGSLKALTLLGMIALSRFTLSTRVSFPGRLGAVLSRMFFYFERITERKIRLRRSHLWEDIRLLLQEVYEEGLNPRPQAAGTRTTTRGYAFLLVFLLVSWSALLF
ncbi:MAG: Gx transporter family protein [Spirochaetales bacterium]